MATAPSPNDLTRQQLDELDALLQRMLSVPLAPAETPAPADAPPVPTPTPPAAVPSWRVDTPTPSPTPAPHIALPPEPPAPVLRYETLKHAPPAPVAPAQATPPAPAPPPPTPSAPAPVQAASAPAPPVPFLLWPLVLLNMLFDWVCGLFGFPGRVLRSGFFKFLYGLIGLGLLAYTAAHVAQQRNWVTLPIPLPWPPAQWPR